MRLNILVAAAVASISAAAVAAPVTFTDLPGLTGGSPAATNVFKADLSVLGIGTIASVTLKGSANGTGSAGRFSGFDLDAIKLSTTDCADAACVAGLGGASLFNLSAGGVFFTPGTQLPPADPALFGTSGGSTIDFTVATLNDFDGDSTTITPDGFLSLGENGEISFNLTTAVDPIGYYLYIGEVGDNGEFAASEIEVSSTPVPEPAALGLLGFGVLGIVGVHRRRRG